MMPDPSPGTGQAQPPTGPAAPPQPHWGQLPPTTGAGQSSWADQGAPASSGTTHWGPIQDAASHGTFSYGDDGEELATADQVDALHAKLGEVHQSLTAMANSGQVGGAAPAAQNQNLQGLTPSRMPARPAPADPLAASAQQRQAAMDRMSAGQQQLAAGQARTQATWVSRQSQGGMAPVQPTGNAMGATTQEATMSGALRGNGMRSPTGNGQSQASFEKSRFGAQ